MTLGSNYVVAATAGTGIAEKWRARVPLRDKMGPPFASQCIQSMVEEDAEGGVVFVVADWLDEVRLVEGDGWEPDGAVGELAVEVAAQRRFASGGLLFWRLAARATCLSMVGSQSSLASVVPFPLAGVKPLQVSLPKKLLAAG